MHYQRTQSISKNKFETSIYYMTNHISNLFKENIVYCLLRFFNILFQNYVFSDSITDTKRNLKCYSIVFK